MYSIVTGAFLLSVLHAAIPNHWLPVITIGKKEQWTIAEIIKVTIAAALAHGMSTIAIGLMLGIVGKAIGENISHFSHFIAPVSFILLGIFFIYRHHRHKHFQLSGVPKEKSQRSEL